MDFTSYFVLMSSCPVWRDGHAVRPDLSLPNRSCFLEGCTDESYGGVAVLEDELWEVSPKIIRFLEQQFSVGRVASQPGDDGDSRPKTFVMQTSSVAM